MAVFSQNRRLKEDSVIGVFFVAAFALGIVIISRAPGYAGSLQEFLFGSITGIPDEDLYVVAGTGLVILAVLFALHKELVTISLDRETARAMGLRVFALDLALYVLVTLAVVISVQTIGNILVLALLITPAATARLLTDRLGVMMVLAPVIGGAVGTASASTSRGRGTTRSAERSCSCSRPCSWSRGCSPRGTGCSRSAACARWLRKRHALGHSRNPA